MRMTPEQRKHYLNGGKFSATYNPLSMDLSGETKAVIGTKITVYQNCVNSPILEDTFNGQFRFNSPSIHGWLPEEDVTDLEIIDEFIDFPEKSTKKFNYRLTYTDEKKLFQNFGKGNWKVPMVVYRSFDEESDEYVKSLSDPQADTIEKQSFNIEEMSGTEWQVIHKENKNENN